MYIWHLVARDAAKNRAVYRTALHNLIYNKGRGREREGRRRRRRKGRRKLS